MAASREEAPSDPYPSEGRQDEAALVGALLGGEESAFVTLVSLYYAPMLRLAMLFVRDREVAEEVVQETWVGVLHGLDRFERRSSLRTWVFRILTNKAKTRGKREARSVPFSALWDPDTDPEEPSVDPSRFRPPGDPNWPGHWASGAAPRSWAGIPEEQLLSQETRTHIRKAIEALPPAQREIITLRDIEGWNSEEVCNVLEITETNQRVLLHRARSKMRQALENYLKQD